MHLRHRLAAFLAMAGRGTRHSLAAFYCLVGRHQAGAIDNIGCERHPEEYRHSCSPKPHAFQAKRECYPSQASCLPTRIAFTGQLNCIKRVVSPTSSDDRTGVLAPRQRHEVLGRKTAMTVRRKEQETARTPKCRGNEGEPPSTVQRYRNTNTNWPSEQPGSPPGSVLLLTVSP